MATKDWNGFKKSGDTYTPNDSTARGWIGTLSNLTTTVKTSIVAAINELVTNITSRVDWLSYAKTGVHQWFDASKAEFKAAGLTCTKNADGSITIDGTTTEEFNYPNNDSFAKCYKLLPSTEYIFSICSAVTNLRLRVFYKATSDSNWEQLVSEGSVENIHFTTPASFYTIWVRIDADANKTFSTTLYPMIKLATDTNTAPAPYAMTNRELTERPPKLVQSANLQANTNITFNGIKGHTYQIVCAHPYEQTDSMYLVTLFDAAGTVTAIKENAAITVSQSNNVITVASTKSTWVKIIDLGSYN